MGSFAAIVTSGSVVVLASVLGGNTQIETNDIDKIVWDSSILIFLKLGENNVWKWINNCCS